MAPSIIAELSVTLRLPLQVFQELANYFLIRPDNQEPKREDDQESTREEVMADQWSDVWYVLTTPLMKLRRISLWLDHDGIESWRFANERLVLAYLTYWIEPERGTALESVTLHLPNLHPLHEKPFFHYTQDSPHPRATTSFTIHRRVRQRYFYTDTTPENVGIVFAPGFPLSLEIHEKKAQLKNQGLENIENISLEEIEELERELWESGYDVERVISVART